MAKGFKPKKHVGKNGDVTWYTRVRYKEYDVSNNHSTKGAADAWGTDVVNQIDKGTFSQFHGDLLNLTFSDALDKWLEEPDVKKHKGYIVETHRANNLKKYPIAKKKLVDLKTSDFRDYRNTRLKTENRATQTVKNDFNIIKGVINTAISEWGFDGLVNQAKAIQFPKAERGRDKRLKEGEKENIFEYAAQDNRPWLLPYIKMALATGMRNGEIASIRPENIDFKKRTVHLVDTKNGDARTAPLLPAALRVLKEYEPNFGDETVFGIATTTVTQSWIDIAKELHKAGKLQDDWRFHDFREVVST
ncbi:MAG: site-specific integrase [Alphaproteobacteria bacterium]|nr:site-specific integrase [Alphaproteobacteria bacterium]